ncbi:DUF397 domain-containing protein [Nocardia abscessus]|uniref:DUF397 domain-containing protein n=1 Tax=Nocardia abscessus TaxID=120957 RepID=UPI0005B8C79C|nr:DUF397 domain-containing protein [Nocardia abscessus]MCC3333410.1 DUF397 domain-containing protein [Nocardia abscessus]
MRADLSGAQWFKSSHSETGGQCVEVAWLLGGDVGVRDSKNPSGPKLIFTPSDWDAFTLSVIDGEFRDPA